MSVYTEPAFYDAAMVGKGAPAMLPLEKSGWRPLYEEAAAWIPPNHAVVDLGCGTGRFAMQLRRSGHRGTYEGVDFSEAALAEARRYLDSKAGFGYADLREWEPDAGRVGHTTYVCLETLEHLDDDEALLHRIPPGHQLVLSVPNYESESHVRTFRSPSDVWASYAHLLEFRRWSLVRLDDRKAIHVCDTVRRADSW